MGACLAKGSPDDIVDEIDDSSDGEPLQLVVRRLDDEDAEITVKRLQFAHDSLGRALGIWPRRIDRVSFASIDIELGSTWEQVGVDNGATVTLAAMPTWSEVLTEEGPNLDGAALHDFALATKSIAVQQQWTGDAPSLLRSWKGVSTTSGRVTALELPSSRLRGVLTEALGAATQLQTLYLLRNSISGSLPHAWAQLVHLQDLTLAYNQLSGELPESWGALVRLRVLNLSHNQLTGVIPSSWAALRELQWMDLSHNMLTGELPDLRPLRNLKRLGLRPNGFDPQQAEASLSQVKAAVPQCQVW